MAKRFKVVFHLEEVGVGPVFQPQQEEFYLSDKEYVRFRAAPTLTEIQTALEDRTEEGRKKVISMYEARNEALAPVMDRLEACFHIAKKYCLVQMVGGEG